MSRIGYLILFLSLSLGCKRYDLSVHDLEWNPYKEGEILIFENNHHIRDSIFVLSIEKTKKADDPLSISPDYLESLDVIVRHTDPVSVEPRYIQNTFLSLFATKAKNTHINFRLAMRNAWFYAGDYSVSELNGLPTKSLTVGNIVYDDVIKLEPKSSEFVDRDEFVTSVYWSKNRGYIRIDLRKGDIWELINSQRNQ